MTKKELAELRDDCRNKNISWKNRGGKLTAYQCQHCDELIVTRQPSRTMVSGKGYWDSATICTNCGKINFVKVWPTGKSEAIKM